MLFCVNQPGNMPISAEARDLFRDWREFLSEKDLGMGKEERGGLRNLPVNINDLIVQQASGNLDLDSLAFRLSKEGLADG